MEWLLKKGLRKCVKCKEVRDLSSYNKNAGQCGGMNYVCRSCVSVAKKTHYEKYKDSINKANIRNHRIRTHGLDPSAYEAFVDYHDYMCSICLMKLTPRQVRIDHNHKDGRLRGVLCNSCNIGIGVLKDNVDSLNRAIKYIESNGMNYKPKLGETIYD